MLLLVYFGVQKDNTFIRLSEYFNNINFNSIEFDGIKGVEFDPFEIINLIMADSPQLKIQYGKK